jgi:hypothetical protein
MMSRTIFLLSGLCIGTALAAEVTSNANPRASSASASNRAAIFETNTLDALAADLKEGDAQTRMNAVRKLGSSSDPESKRILIDRFKQIPQPEPSTDSHQSEKAEVLRQVLPKLPSSERTPLLLSTLREEISALKAAESVGRGKYYPKDLAALTITSLAAEGFSEEARHELALSSSDQSIPQGIRVAMLAAVLRHDLQKEGGKTPEEMARSVLKAVTVRPVAPIPWDIYNDPSNRIAYSKTDVFQNRQKEMAKWLKSDDAVRTTAYESLLHSSGLAAVQQLVAELDQKSVPVERRDYFALLATDILRGQSPGGYAPSGDIEASVDALAKYVEGMEDAGAFSRRAVAAANLNAFWEKAKQAKRIAIESAAGIPAARSH